MDGPCRGGKRVKFQNAGCRCGLGQEQFGDGYCSLYFIKSYGFREVRGHDRNHEVESIPCVRGRQSGCCCDIHELQGCRGSVWVSLSTC